MPALALRSLGRRGATANVASDIRRRAEQEREVELLLARLGQPAADPSPAPLPRRRRVA